MDYTVDTILQGIILEWVTIPFSRESFQSKPGSPTLQVDSLLAEPPGKPKNTGVGSLSLLQRIFPTPELGSPTLQATSLPAELRSPPDLGLREGRDMLWVKSNLVGLPLTMRKKPVLPECKELKKTSSFPSMPKLWSCLGSRDEYHFFSNKESKSATA